jgi:hypothetical protein
VNSISISELLDKVSERERSIKKVMVNEIRPSLIGDNNTFIINNSYDSSGLFGNVSSWLGIPGSFAKTIPNDLFKYNVESMLKVKDVTKLAMLVDKGEPVLMYQDNGFYISPTSLVTTITEKFRGMEVDLLDIKDLNSINIKFNSPSDVKQPKVGDMVRSGVNLKFSEFNLTKPVVEAASYRLSCTNGATYPAFKRSFKLAHSTGYAEVILNATQEAFTYFNEALYPLMVASTEKHVNPVQAIRKIAKENNLSPKEIDAVLVALNFESGESMWSVSNAFTRAANNPNLSLTEVSKLQSIGGSVVNQANYEFCDHCHSRM